MVKITRAPQKVFASSAGGTEIGKFGSVAAGAPAYTTDPVVIQSLAAFLNGWYAAIIGNNSPPIQDMNALFFLAFRQIAYVLQTGVPEWDSATNYYTNSMVSSGGIIYVSQIDDNLNQPVSDSTKWLSYGMGIGAGGSEPVTATRALVGSDDGKV